MQQVTADGRPPPGWIGRAGQAFDIALNGAAVLSSLALLAIMLATVLKVFVRLLFNEGLIGIDQVSGTLMLYVTFLGAAWVLRREAHITIDLVMASRSAAAKRKLNVVNSLIGAAICFAIVYFGTEEVISSLRRNILIPAEIEIPRAINLAVIPVGCLLLGIEFLRRARRHYSGEVPEGQATKLEF